MNLRDYIRGQRQGKEANQLERKAMDDPFLQDAIDGYDSVEGDHMSAIENLEKRLVSPKKHSNKRMWIWAAAAAIILLIGIPLLLQKPYMEDDTTIVSSDTTPQKKGEETPPLKDDTVLLADHHELKKTPTSTLPAKTSRETIEATAVEDIEVAEVMEEIESLPDKDIRLSNIQSVTEKTFIRESQKEVIGTLAGTEGVTASRYEQDKNVRIRGRATSITQPDKIVVSGRIVDETGEPIPGVTIKHPNTPTGTVSDMAGNFLLIIPKDEKETLIASYIGMKDSSIPLKENVGDIMMKADDMALNEVVIVGHGIQKKGVFTGSVSSVSESSIFEEEEFREYFIENYDKDICVGQNIDIVVEFFIDPIGRPSQIDIKENNCPALENEIKRLLLGSPHWSKTDRKVTLQIKLP